MNSFAESGSFDEIISESLQAMRAAYSEKVIAFRRKRSNEIKGGGDVVGVYDDFTVSIASKAFYNAYKERSGCPLPFFVWYNIIKRDMSLKACRLNCEDMPRSHCIVMSRDIAKLPL